MIASAEVPCRDKGGFLFFDDCGVNAPAQAMVRLFLAQMRRVMPEHHIERIPNNHEVYNNFYMLGGPPMGFNVYWWGARPPNQPYLEGISVGGKLSVLISRRDYLCAMRSVSLPGFGVQYSPRRLPIHDQRRSLFPDKRRNFRLLRLRPRIALPRPTTSPPRPPIRTHPCHRIVVGSRHSRMPFTLCNLCGSKGIIIA